MTCTVVFLIAVSVPLLLRVVACQVFPAINFYSSDRELRLELVEVSGAAIAQCGRAGASAQQAEEVAAPVAGDAAIPPSVFLTISSGVFEGGLQSQDPAVGGAAVDSHMAEKRAFLEDVISGDAGTSGGRLADWLTRVVDQVCVYVCVCLSCSPPCLSSLLAGPCALVFVPLLG